MGQSIEGQALELLAFLLGGALLGLAYDMLRPIRRAAGRGGGALDVLFCAFGGALFFLLVFYVNPIYRMLSGLNNYRSYNKKYSYSFEGDDQLAELNDGITELTGENQMLRKRVANLRAKVASTGSAHNNN